MKRPAFIALMVLIAGRVLGTFLPIPAWILLFAVFYLILGSAYLLFRRPRDTPPQSGNLLLLAVLFIGLYQQRALVENNRLAVRAAQHLTHYVAASVSGRLAREPLLRNGYARLLVKDLSLHEDGNSIPLPTKALVYVYGEAAKKVRSADGARGDLVRLYGEARIPSSPHNPTLLNYRAFLAQKGIHLIFRLKYAHEMEIKPPQNGRSLFARILLQIHRFRLRCENNFDTSLSARNAALIKALTLGMSHQLDPGDREIFLRTGLMHLFAVSGLHTGMMAVLLFMLLRLARLRFRSVALLTIAGVWLFAAYTGFRSPVIRAAVMVTCLLASYWLPGMRRHIDGISMLTFAAFWVLIFNPRCLFQADFLMSYLSVFFIMTLMPFFREHFTFDIQRAKPEKRGRLSNLNRYVLLPLYVVISVQLALLPLLALYYHRFSLAGFIANPIAVPIAFCCLTAGFFQVILGTAVPVLIPFLAWVTGILLTILRGVANLFSQIPLAAIHLSPLPWFVVAGYYATLLGGNWILEKKEWKRRRAIHFAMAIGVIIALLVWLPIFRGGKSALEVVFLDVGQGDCIYVEFPGGQNLLIDGGRNYPRDMGRCIIAPFLRNRGIDSVDVVIATHADADHIGGLVYVLDHFFVNYVIEGGSKSYSKVYRDFERKTKEWGVVKELAARGDSIEGYPGAELVFLNPPRQTPLEWGSNDRSLVLRLKKGDTAFLFTGDAAFEAERSMIASGMDLRATVLKVGHHGSRFSSGERFLEAVHPMAAVISVEAHNSYGHPHPSVLKRLKAHKMRVYRTDKDGAITMRVRGDKIEIQTQRRKPKARHR